jgi:hypothetical protein
MEDNPGLPAGDFSVREYRVHFRTAIAAACASTVVSNDRGAACTKGCIATATRQSFDEQGVQLTQRRNGRDRSSTLAATDAVDDLRRAGATFIHQVSLQALHFVIRYFWFGRRSRSVSCFARELRNREGHGHRRRLPRSQRTHHCHRRADVTDLKPWDAATAHLQRFIAERMHK